MSLLKKWNVSDYTELEKMVEQTLFPYQWKGLIMFNDKVIRNEKLDLSKFWNLSQLITEVCIKNPFFIWMSSDNEKNAIHYKAFIEKWTKEFIGKAFNKQEFPIKYIPKIVSVESYKSQIGSYFSSEIEVVTAFLYYQKVKKLRDTSNFKRTFSNCSKVELWAKKKAKKWIKKYPNFIYTVGPKNDTLSSLFDEIFLILCGDEQIFHFKNKQFLVTSAVN